MGDRTHVELLILKEHEEKAKGIIHDYDEKLDMSFADGSLFVNYVYYEVNYGKLDFLYKLQENGIAYDQNWNDGDEYTAGVEYCRFTSEGDIIIKEVYDSDHSINVNKLVSIIHDHTALIDLIQKQQKHIETPSWDNQVEYGKKHQMRRLLTPDEFKQSRG